MSGLYLWWSISLLFIITIIIIIIIIIITVIFVSLYWFLFWWEWILSLKPSSQYNNSFWDHFAQSYVTSI